MLASCRKHHSISDDVYMTLTRFQLDEMYGRSDQAQEFISEIIKGQEGVAHPQVLIQYSSFRANMQCTYIAFASYTLNLAGSTVAGCENVPRPQIHRPKERAVFGCEPHSDCERDSGRGGQKGLVGGLNAH